MRKERDASARPHSFLLARTGQHASMRSGRSSPPIHVQGAKQSLAELLEEKILQSLAQTEPEAEPIPVPPARKNIRRSSTMPALPRSSNGTSPPAPKGSVRMASPLLVPSPQQGSPQRTSPPLRESSLQSTRRESRDAIAPQESEAITATEIPWS